MDFNVVICQMSISIQNQNLGFSVSKFSFQYNMFEETRVHLQIRLLFYFPQWKPVKNL